MSTNFYTFKVTFYDQSGEYWYPPIEAKTYSKAVRLLYNDSRVNDATLKCIALPDGRAIAGINALRNPTEYDNE